MFNKWVKAAEAVVGNAVDAAKELQELTAELQEKYKTTLNRAEIMRLVKLAAEIPYVGKPFQAFLILATALKFFESLPGQVERVVTKEHLTETVPIMVVPLEGYLMVLSFSDETDWQCNFYTDDEEISNLETLSELKGDDYFPRTLSNKRFGIERQAFVNVTGLNRYPQITSTPEEGVSTAINVALQRIPGYDLIGFIPGAVTAIDSSVSGISKTVVNAMFHNLTNTPQLEAPKA